jgi:hypothetical protein
MQLPTLAPTKLLNGLGTSTIPRAIRHVEGRRVRRRLTPFTTLGERPSPQVDRRPSLIDSITSIRSRIRTLLRVEEGG